MSVISNDFRMRQEDNQVKCSESRFNFTSDENFQEFRAELKQMPAFWLFRQIFEHEIRDRSRVHKMIQWSSVFSQITVYLYIIHF